MDANSTIITVIDDWNDAVTLQQADGIMGDNVSMQSTGAIV